MPKPYSLSITYLPNFLKQVGIQHAVSCKLIPFEHEIWDLIASFELLNSDFALPNSSKAFQFNFPIFFYDTLYWTVSTVEWVIQALIVLWWSRLFSFYGFRQKRLRCLAESCLLSFQNFFLIFLLKKCYFFEVFACEGCKASESTA